MTTYKVEYFNTLTGQLFESPQSADGFYTREGMVVFFNTELKGMFFKSKVVTNVAMYSNVVRVV